MTNIPSDDESEPDISRLVEVKIPIINLSDAHSSKAVTTQIPDSSVIVPTIPILPVQSPFEPTMPMSNKVTADEEDISGLVEVKIPLINLAENGPYFWWLTVFKHLFIIV